MAPQKTFRIEIVTPERRVFSGEVESAVLPGSEGRFGVLAGHAATLAVLAPGEIRVARGGETHVFATFGGFVEVLRDKVSVAVETAERPEEIDRASAERDRDAAAAEHKTAKTMAARKAAEERMKRAGVRLRAAARGPAPTAR